jgi:arylsulfatase A-like enzyme
LQARDATIAERLKPLGFASGGFGEDPLGDGNEFRPSMLARRADATDVDLTLSGDPLKPH